MDALFTFYRCESQLRGEGGAEIPRSGKRDALTPLDSGVLLDEIVEYHIAGLSIHLGAICVPGVLRHLSIERLVERRERLDESCLVSITSPIQRTAHPKLQSNHQRAIQGSRIRARFRPLAAERELFAYIAEVIVLGLQSGLVFVLCCVGPVPVRALRSRARVRIVRVISVRIVIVHRLVFAQIDHVSFYEERFLILLLVDFGLRLLRQREPDPGTPGFGVEQDLDPIGWRWFW